MKYLHLLWAGLTRKKIRTGLTLMSILIAFVLFGYMCAIAQALTSGVEVAGLDRIVVLHRTSIIRDLPFAYKARLERIPGVEHVVHASWFGGIYQKPENFFAQMPVEPEEFLEMYPEYLLPEEQKAAWLQTRTGAVVGRQTAEKFNWKVGDRIPIQATIWWKEGGEQTWEFDLVGIYDGAERGTDTTQFFFRYDYFDEAREEAGKGLVGWYTVRVEDPANAAEVARAIDAEFANSAAETRAQSEKAFMQGFAKQIGNIGAMLVAVLSAVFFTILLVAGNTMAQSVRERTQELGVLKAIGFSHRQVLAMVLGESMLLAILGGGLGLGLAYSLISLGDPTGGALPIFFLSNRHILTGAGLVLGLGLASGVLPAVGAMRLEAAVALRRN